MAVGHYSELQIEQGELGLDVRASGAVCAECLADAGLTKFVEGNLQYDACSFCGGSADWPIAADVYDVMVFIASRLREEWAPSNELMYFDKESETGFAGPAWHIWDVLEHEGPIAANDKFEEFMLGSFAELQWSPRDIYDVTASEALQFGWDGLVEVVKHRQRFFFILEAPEHVAGDPGRRILGGGELLEVLAGLIREYDLVRSVEVDEDFYRVRIHPARKRYSSAKDLGAPPAAGASQSRMSPAGIPMFYAADDLDTALAETLDAGRTRRKGVTLATFRLRRSCRIVDLDRLPDIASIFDEDVDAKTRHELYFLHSFRRAVGGHVDRDGREHVEYVPTQVVCEYLRHQFRDADGHSVHGLAWESTRRPGRRNVVLFIDRYHCVEVGETPSHVDDPIVELLASEHRRLP